MKYFRYAVMLIGIAILVSLCFLPVFAEGEGNMNSGTCGENAVWSFDEATGTLTISGSGPMEDYEGMADFDEYYSKFNNKTFPWYNASEIWLKIRHVVVEEGITTVGDCAFMYCKKLETVTLPAGMESIGERAFAEARNLTSVDFAEGPRVIKDQAFSSSGLRELVIPEGTERLEGYMFTHNDTIERVVFPNSLVDMGDIVFRECSALKSVVLPNNLEKLPVLLLNCHAIETVEFPIGSKYVGGIAYCDALREVIIHEGALECGGFAYCPNLKELALPESLTELALYGALVRLSIPKNVERLELNTEALEEVVLSPENPYFRYEEGCLIENATEELIYARYASAIPESIRGIRDGALYGATAIRELRIPEGVTSISVDALKGCSELKYLYVHENVTFIAGIATRYCPLLERIEIAEGNERYRAEGRSIITRTAFTELDFEYPANALVSYFAGDPLPEGVEILCSVHGDVRTYEIPDGITTVMDWSLYLPNLEELTIPKSVTRIHPYMPIAISQSLKRIFYEGSREEWDAIEFTEIEGTNSMWQFWKEITDEEEGNLVCLNGLPREEYVEPETTRHPIVTYGPPETNPPVSQGTGCKGVSGFPLVAVLLVPVAFGSLRKKE